MENLKVWAFSNQHGSHYAGGTESEAHNYVSLLNEKIFKQYKGYQSDINKLQYTVNETDLPVKEFTDLPEVIKAFIHYNR